MINLKEWICRERAEHLYRAHPACYRILLACLFAEGVGMALLLLVFVGWLVVLFVHAPRDHFIVGLFLLFNLIGTLVAWRNQMADRPWNGLPELPEADWPRLHELVRETAAAVGAPPVAAIHLDPGAFNASVSTACPLFPPLRRHVLILGYPLFAALGPRGLRALLAHELGHLAHRDTLRAGAIHHLQTFWTSVDFGIVTAFLAVWRHFWLLRLARTLSPLERERESAADRSIAQTCGLDALRELLVTLDLRAPDSDLGEILPPLVHTPAPSASPSPAAAIRTAMRRPLSPDLVRRRLSRALRSIVPPTEEHPPLSVRTQTTDPADLLPYAAAPQDALETLFGAPTALDAIVDEALRPALDAITEDNRTWQDRLAALEALPPSPSAAYWRIDVLRFMGRTEEADRAQTEALAIWPGNPTLESRPLLDAITDAPSPEAAAPAAARLETLLAAEPFLRDDAAAPLLAHYLEIGDADRAKALLALLQRSEKRYLRLTLAKLRPTDDFVPMPLGEAERARIAALFAGRGVREVYAIWRRYGDTAAVTSFFVVRLSFLASPYHNSYFPLADRVVPVVSGTRALFRRFAELGIRPIPVPKKAPAPPGAETPPPATNPQPPEGTPP